MSSQPDETKVGIHSDLEDWQKWVVVGVATLIFIIITWLLFRPIFKDDNSQETTARDTAAVTVPSTPSITDPTPTTPAADFDEPFPVDQIATIERMGLFSASEASDAAGKALLFKLTDGSHLLRLEDFFVNHDAQLSVQLSWGEFYSEADLDSGQVDLGPLKSAVGNQNYFVPPEANAEVFEMVALTCEACTKPVAYALLPR
ncbi:MAG: hypothetical protein HKM24_08010 [Gammaproteobacteria bacterium]|nr:hypothetical protein [Gammaproteobacteria bacterium]